MSVICIQQNIRRFKTSYIVGAKINKTFQVSKTWKVLI